MSFTFLVFDSQPNFRSNNTKFQFTDYCLQSRPKWHHYQILLFWGDVVGLSVATHYGASKCYAPTHNLVTIIKSFLWLLLVRITLPSKISNHMAVWVDFFSLWTPYENHQLHLKQPHCWGRLLLHYLKTYQVVLLFETLPLRASLSKVVAGILCFCQPWARVKVSW
jgi:hypothetical protein